MKGIQQKSFQLRSCLLNAPSNSSICFLPSLSSLIHIFLSNIFYLYSFSLICSCSADSLLAFFYFLDFVNISHYLTLLYSKSQSFPSYPADSYPHVLLTLVYFLPFVFNQSYLLFYLFSSYHGDIRFGLSFFPCFFSKKKTIFII